MNYIFYLSLLLLSLFFVNCQNNKKEEINSNVIKAIKTTIDFDPQLLNNSVWSGTRFSDGHLIYMKFDSVIFCLLEIDTNKQEYIETLSRLNYELTDSSCLISNYPISLGPEMAHIFLKEYFLNDKTEDSLFRDITNSELIEYKDIKRKYFPMHFKNDLLGELNLSTLDEITFRNSSNDDLIKMKKDTFYSNHVGTFFKNKGIVRGGEEIKHSLKTDSSNITYHFFISQSQDRKYKYSNYRERLKGEKEVKWVGDLMTTYRRDYLILEYKPLQYAIDHKRPQFVKIIKLDSSLLKYPFNGRY